MNKVDIVIPFGIEGIGWEDNDLRYALRSIEENFKDLGEIWIVGYKPVWLTNVNYIKAFDPYKSNKDANLINKIIIACCEEKLTNSFLFTSDDHFFLQPVDSTWFEIPTFDDRQLSFDRNKRLNRWQTRIVNTENALIARNKSIKCFEAHIPYMFNKKLYPQIMLQYDYGFDVGYTVSSLYFNTFGCISKKVEENTVARINEKPQSFEWLENHLKDKMFFNYSTVAFCDDIKKFLALRFTKKSKFEL